MTKTIHKSLLNSPLLHRLAGVFILLGMNGCASSDDISLMSKNQFVEVFYARVNDITPITFESHVPEAMAAGAVDGAFFSYDSEDVVGNMIFGAFFAGLVTSVVEGDRKGFEFGLNAVDGDYVIVTLDELAANEGDCVMVRMSSDVRVYPTDDVNCSTSLSEY